MVNSNQPFELMVNSAGKLVDSSIIFLEIDDLHAKTGQFGMLRSISGPYRGTPVDGLGTFPATVVLVCGLGGSQEYIRKMLEKNEKTRMSSKEAGSRDGDGHWNWWQQQLCMKSD